MTRLRRGKTKNTLQSSVDSALLAVEIYNKPRTTFRSEGFIALMIIAWTRLFHAHFNNTIGDKYYYKEKNGRYEIIDGERKAWELSKCIKEYGLLSRSVESNLQFFIKLRNKIEHRHIDKREVDTLIFGECQALLYNYENLLVQLFGEQYALNESLVYSLQFSHLRTPQQQEASKSALSRDLADISSYVINYRNSLDEDVYNSQEFRIKLLQIPKVANTDRADAAIEFVKWNELSDEDKAAYEKVAAIVKDKKVTVSAANARRLKAKEVVSSVNSQLSSKALTIPLHVVLYKLFKIRPPNGADDPFDTNAEYCLYDEAHGDYVYQSEWVELLIHFLQTSGFTSDQLREKQRNGEALDIREYES